MPVPPPYAPANGALIPTEDSRALVAYLLSLKQAPLPGAEAAAAPAVAAARPGSTPTTPAEAAPALDAAEGAKRFAANCAACRGAQGAGVPGVFPSLHGNPVVVANDAQEHIATVLHGASGKPIDGVTYAAQMPPFAATLADQQIADIIDHERTSWGNHAPTVTAQDVAAARAKK